MFSGVLPPSKAFSAACSAPAVVAFVSRYFARAILQVGQLSAFRGQTNPKTIF
jgi:hypothetical protein